LGSKRYYSQAVIDEVRDKADIVQVISEYLTLRPAGQNFKALCPFHKEKTPSFMVNPSRQMFRCFGCGEGGNVFTFLMKIDGLTFGQAVRALATRYGVPVRTEDGEKIDKTARFRQALLDLNRKVAAHFQRNLIDGEVGSLALEYLKERGVGDDAIRTFGIGYAKESWDDVCGKFGKKGSDQELLETVGLASKGKQGSYYDRFRGRIIFPIVDVAGNVRGFGGRVLSTAHLEGEKDRGAKYLNSPESLVYHKGRTLYGLHQARDAVRSEGFVVLVEGYMDVIALFEAGIRNVVATCGTALTPQQCGLIKRYTERPVVFFDADIAGTSASLRSFDVFSTEGLRPRVFKAPGEDDPDDYVKRVGGEKLLEALRQAPAFPEFLIKETLREFDVGTVEGKLSALKEVLPSLSRLTLVESNHYVRMLADELGVDQEIVFAELHRLSGRLKVGEEIQVLKERQFIAEERDLVRMIVTHKEALRIACESVEPSLITNDFLRELVECCFTAGRSGKEVTLSGLLDKFEGETERSFIAQLAFCESVIEMSGFSRLVDKLRRNALARRANEMHKEYLSSLKGGDVAAEGELEREFVELKRSAVAD